MTTSSPAHPKPRRWRATAALVGLAALLTAACGDDGDDEAAQPTAERADDDAAADSAGEATGVTLVLDWTPNTNHGGIYLADANGWYEEEGLDVTIIQPDAGGGLSQLAAGNAEFAITESESIIPARAQGVPVVSVAAIIDHNTSALLAPADRGITSPADLAGKTYGGFGGQLERALISELVACDGGDPDAVTYVEVGNVDFRVGFERGDYDFVWIFEAWDGIRLEQLEGMDVTTIPFIEHTDCIPDWYTPVIATSESQLADQPELVEAFMAATSRGYQAAMEDPEAAADALLDAAPELDEELVRASAAFLAEEYAAEPAEWGYQDADIWANFGEFVVESGMIDEGIDTEEAFTNEHLPAR